MKRSEHETEWAAERSATKALACLMYAVIITVVSLVGMGVIAYYGNLYNF